MKGTFQAVRGRAGDAALIGLTIALLAGGALRIAYANWDATGHLHPDERYISTVANDTSWPSTPWGYFDVERSPLSPYNIETGRSYVYGLLPLTGSKLAADALGEDDYDHLYLVARHISALLDTATIFMVFLATLLLMEEWGRRRAATGATIAALLYAFTVTAIQHAHYFTVDSWLIFFSFLTLLLTMMALRASKAMVDGNIDRWFAAVGVSTGLTVACKVPGALVLAPVAVAIVADGVVVATCRGRSAAAVRVAITGLVVVISSYLTFRLVSPYSFARSNWLDITLNDGFRSALNDEFRRVNGEFLFPPSYQWLLSTPIWSPLRNLVQWQLGWPLGVAALVGVVLLVVRIVRATITQVRTRGRTITAEAAAGATTQWLTLLVFMLVVFFWIAPRFAHMGRYLLPITPVLAIAAAYALVDLLGGRRRLLIAVASAIVVLTAAWALAFMQVFAHENTRIAASDWIVAHAQPGARIANEHWDDSLPVGGRAQPFTLLELPVFEPDDPTKLRKLYDVLSESDYYVLSSPRAWRTIGRLPDRFPLMTRFYQELFEGKLGFRETASFERSPTLFGVEIDDSSAEEAFWVYDHPPVRIYKKTERFDWATFRSVLCPHQNSACPPAED
jgi:hypothetical protein